MFAHGCQLRLGNPGLHVGPITNLRLEALVAPCSERLSDPMMRKGGLIAEGAYWARSWDRKRRIIYKAEAMEEGENTRFAVTTRPPHPSSFTTGT